MNRGLDERRACARVMSVALLCAAFASPAAAPMAETAAASPAAPGAAAAPRPRIGLVLGGGGAKGAAHVGVLGVL